MSDEHLSNERAITLPVSSKIILCGAGAFSVIWLVGALIVALCFDNGSHAPTKINEWGDFAAGVSAPIAFVWLVVAVVLQSTELREQRRELSLTRDEFKHNRSVMKAQAKEAEKQAKFIEEQTKILGTRQANAEAEDIFSACVALVATRLRQYTNAWSFILVERYDPNGPTQGSDISLKTKFYEGASDNLVIARTAQMLRTQLREMREKAPRPDLRAEYPYDFQRIYSAVTASAEKISALPPSFQIKAATLELDDLKTQLTFIADHAGIQPFGPISS
ncbi:hypothetical protein [Agrobacterium radiobacter]|uniref:hypothetical protein n=1 Tax=Agrobacterium radiobacter TaxID=362 RepID=UPI003F84141C